MRSTVQNLSSLLSGTHSDDVPISPLHASYRDFLCDSTQSVPFFIDMGKANQRMALGCFGVMEQLLEFNICRLPTSFVSNDDIPNITKLREAHIPSPLSYACQKWTFHVSAASDQVKLQSLVRSFFHDQFLYWLEVMSVVKSSPQTALRLLNTVQVGL